MAIFVRPVREQVEHDRVIRFLQTRWRRRFAVEINTGEERAASIRLRETPLYPDLILTPTDGGKPHAIVEVETGESVNHLEALSQWVAFSKAKARFYLYVPAASVDTARRLCTAFRVAPSEIWSYHTLGDQIRFTQVTRAPAAGERTAEAAVKPVRAKSAAKRPARAPARAAKPSGKTKSTPRATVKRAAKAVTRRTGRAERPARAAAARKTPPARKTTGTRRAKTVRAQKRR
ncbi:MAG: hypothetical protein GEV06_09280 [Luteitalea sp.]|nr:hypothetical protein [Luteitalea sp.]